MSYSFSVQSHEKQDALVQVGEKMREVVAQQPVHARDEATVCHNAAKVIDLIADDETKDIAVSCNGSLTTYSDAPATVVSASVSCTASLVSRKAAA